MVKRLLVSKIEDTFVLTGVGIVIVPGIPYPSDTIRVIRVGEMITLVRPDGSELETSIKRIEMINHRDRSTPATHAPFVVTAAIEKQDVPPGTEVWLCD